MNITSSKKYLQEVYPRNLLLTASMIGNLPIPDEYTPEVIDSVKKAVSLLSERDQHIIHLRFVERKCFKAIGEVYGVKQERARQLLNLALRQLRKPDKWRYICEHTLAKNS